MKNSWHKFNCLWVRPFVSIMLIIVLVMGGFSGGGYADSNKRYAKIAEIKGDVMLMKNGGEREFNAFKGMSLSEGDRIKTGIGAEVTLQIDDAKVVKVADNTTLDVDALKGSLENGSDKTSMQLWGGKVVISITKKLGNDEKFDIKTPTAIMGVRGTLFFVGEDKGKTDLAVLEGTVAATTYVPVENDNGSGTGSGLQPVELTVTQNQQVSLTQEIKTPEQVVRTEIVSAESLDLLVLETIKEQPTRVDQNLLKNIDQVIQQKQIEQEQKNQKLMETQQQQQQQLTQDTPTGQPIQQPEVIFAPEVPTPAPGTPENPENPATSDAPIVPPTPNDTPSGGDSNGTGTGTGTTRDHDHTPIVTTPVTPPATPSLSVTSESDSYTVEEILGPDTDFMFNVQGTFTTATAALDNANLEFLNVGAGAALIQGSNVHVPLRAKHSGASILTLTVSDGTTTVSKSVTINVSTLVDNLYLFADTPSQTNYGSLGLTPGDYVLANQPDYESFILAHKPIIVSKEVAQLVITSINTMKPTQTIINDWIALLMNNDNWNVSGNLVMAAPTTPPLPNGVVMTFTSTTVSVEDGGSGLPAIANLSNVPSINQLILQPSTATAPNISIITATWTAGPVQSSVQFRLEAPFQSPPYFQPMAY